MNEKEGERFPGGEKSSPVASAAKCGGGAGGRRTARAINAADHENDCAGGENDCGTAAIGASRSGGSPWRVNIE